MSDKNIDVSVSFSGAIMMLFFWFWQQSGWYRVDCALGEKAACDLIHVEYVKKSSP